MHLEIVRIFQWHKIKELPEKTQLSIVITGKLYTEGPYSGLNSLAMLTNSANYRATMLLMSMLYFTV